MTSDEIKKSLFDCNTLKPNDLIIDDLQWKYLVWAVLKGKNILFVGPTRCGKTKAAKSVAKSFSTFTTEILSEEDLKLLKSDPSIKIEKIEELSE
jgi:MoxR-like ATPase